jgi:hypothetical protein
MALYWGKETSEFSVSAPHGFGFSAWPTVSMDFTSPGRFNHRRGMKTMALLTILSYLISPFAMFFLLKEIGCGVLVGQGETGKLSHQ